MKAELQALPRREQARGPLTTQAQRFWRAWAQCGGEPELSEAGKSCQHGGRCGPGACLSYSWHGGDALRHGGQLRGEAQRAGHDPCAWGCGIYLHVCIQQLLFW